MYTCTLCENILMGLAIKPRHYISSKHYINEMYFSVPVHLKMI